MQGRGLMKRRSTGGKNGGGKSNKEIADAWERDATPIYEERRGACPEAWPIDIAKHITGLLGSRAPSDKRVARWVSAEDKNAASRRKGLYRHVVRLSRATRLRVRLCA